MADYFWISPRTANNVRQPLGRFLVRWAIEQTQAAGAPKVIQVSLDDSIAAKHKQTRCIEPVDWHYNHVESTPHLPRYTNGLTYLVCTVAMGPVPVTFDVRLYLRAYTVRRINRRRPPEHCVRFTSKTRLGRQILQAPAPLLPEGFAVYVYFDSWYPSAKLIKFIRRQK